VSDSVRFLIPLLVGALAGVILLVAGLLAARRSRAAAANEAERLLEEARQDADAKQQETLLAAQEKSVAAEAETDQRERELEARETRLDSRARDHERARAKLERRTQEVERRVGELDTRDARLKELEAETRADRAEARQTLERIAGLSAEQARVELIAGLEDEARREGARLARKIEDEYREKAEREAQNLVIKAAGRISLRGPIHSTVTFISLPSDEMKGRIIGREGRNIRALEMATGIDLIVDDTPQAILISCFDPTRREVARVAIERLVEDGRIHPARIEEVVEKVREEIDTLIEEEGSQAAFAVGISDLHPRLARLVGRMKFHSNHGQDLLRHCMEVALIAGHMAAEVGAQAAVAVRSGLLHEVGRVSESTLGHSAMASSELAGRYGESEEVVHAIQSLHPDVETRSVEAILLDAANRLSENRPGARKENLEIFIERLKRLEALAVEFDGVERAYAVKAGKEIRVLVDAARITDDEVYDLSKRIARRIEQEVNFPGQVKVNVVRETRSVRFAT
jgi:ribonuclease Y